MVKHTANERKFLDELWRRSANLPEVLPDSKKLPSLDVLKKSQWCKEFEQLMRNRLVLGAFRYGQIDEQDFSNYDLATEAQRRIERFKEDGNMEHLVDAANMCLLRFFWGGKQGDVFKPVDDGEHTPLIKNKFSF